MLSMEKECMGSVANTLDDAQACVTTAGAASEPEKRHPPNIHVMHTIGLLFGVSPPNNKVSSTMLFSWFSYSVEPLFPSLLRLTSCPEKREGIVCPLFML
ncbi:Uncharacterized protein HZ326_13376 [Fusarium oxysporum f. sp. albedinis]|nr:Uncharacterized protein HZ326_13376 [Fusarium oxysporum f. sp. albedinis]